MDSKNTPWGFSCYLLRLPRPPSCDGLGSRSDDALPGFSHPPPGPKSRINACMCIYLKQSFANPSLESLRSNENRSNSCTNSPKLYIGGDIIWHISILSSKSRWTRQQSNREARFRVIVTQEYSTKSLYYITTLSIAWMQTAHDRLRAKKYTGSHVCSTHQHSPIGSYSVIIVAFIFISCNVVFRCEALYGAPVLFMCGIRIKATVYIGGRQVSWGRDTGDRNSWSKRQTK